MNEFQPEYQLKGTRYRLRCQYKLQNDCQYPQNVHAIQLKHPCLHLVFTCGNWNSEGEVLAHPSKYLHAVLNERSLVILKLAIAGNEQ